MFQAFKNSKLNFTIIQRPINVMGIAKWWLQLDSDDDESQQDQNSGKRKPGTKKIGKKSRFQRSCGQIPTMMKADKAKTETKAMAT